LLWYLSQGFASSAAVAIVVLLSLSAAVVAGAAMPNARAVISIDSTCCGSLQAYHSAQHDEHNKRIKIATIIAYLNQRYSRYHSTAYTSKYGTLQACNVSYPMLQCVHACTVYILSLYSV
jgi:hypothetical protein